MQVQIFCKKYLINLKYEKVWRKMLQKEQTFEYSCKYYITTTSEASAHGYIAHNKSIV